MRQSTFNKRVGTVLRELRIRDGYTQTDVAKCSGLYQSAVSRIENGEYEITLYHALKLEMKFGWHQLLDPILGVVKE